MEAFVFANGAVHQTADAAAVRAAHLAGQTVWVDLDAENSSEGCATLLDAFALHPLVVEDLWSVRALPKVEDFGDYLYILVHAVGPGASAAQLELLKLDVVLGRNFVISHHRHSSRSVAALRAELLRTPRLMQKGAPWIAHALLDHLVDHYLPVIDDLDDEIDLLQKDVIAHAGTPEGQSLLPRIFTVKRGLQALRRVSTHQREILLRLSRAEFPAIPDEAIPFYRDVYDHFARVTDLADSYRDQATGALDAYVSVQSNRMNEVMKTLTLISTIVLPLTFITSLYGMNLKMPGTDSPHALGVVFVIMLLTAALVAGWFRYKKWF